MSVAGTHGLEAVATKVNSFSGGTNSIDQSFALDPAGGPYNALCFVYMQRAPGAATVSAVPAFGFLTGPGKWKHVTSKYKPEIDCTVEVWSCWDLINTDSLVNYGFTFAETADNVGILFRIYDGAAQREDWHSSPVWGYSTTPNETLEFHTVDLPSQKATGAAGGVVGQVVFAVEQGSATITAANGFVAFDTDFLQSYNMRVVEAGTYSAVSDNAKGHLQLRHSVSSILAVSLNIYAPQYFDAKEGTAPEYTMEEEMRLKERITELEREVTTLREQQAVDQADFVESNRALTAERDSAQRKAADSEQAVTQLVSDQAKATKQLAALQQQVDAIPQLVAERDSTIAQLTDALNLAAEQHVALQQELDATRSELQQTLAALPAHIQQAADQIAQQRLTQLLADPNALRELLMQHAQAAQQPRDLFGALQGLQQLG